MVPVCRDFAGEVKSSGEPVTIRARGIEMHAYLSDNVLSVLSGCCVKNSVSQLGEQ